MSTNAPAELQVFHTHDWSVSTKVFELSPPVNYQQEILHNSVEHKHYTLKSQDELHPLLCSEIYQRLLIGSHEKGGK